jgi:hypothetical protein
MATASSAGSAASADPLSLPRVAQMASPGRGITAPPTDAGRDEQRPLHHAGTEGRVSGPAPGHADYGSFAAFSDPDGNGWLLQEIKTRLPGR